MSILKSTNIGRSSFEVDLGLSVNWCAYNVGAKKPEEAGLYFAWGDTKGYRESEIKEDMFTWNWYKTLPASKIKGDLKLKDDAAHEYFGGNWRMPIDEEFKELRENTKQTIEVLNGIKGIRFTATNGNSIFIPFAGYAIRGSVLHEGDVFGCWSSVIDNGDFAYYFRGDSDGDARGGSSSSCLGFSVRAVIEKS